MKVACPACGTESDPQNGASSDDCPKCGAAIEQEVAIPLGGSDDLTVPEPADTIELLDEDEIIPLGGSEDVSQHDASPPESLSSISSEATGGAPIGEETASPPPAVISLGTSSESDSASSPEPEGPQAPALPFAMPMPPAPPAAKVKEEVSPDPPAVIAPSAPELEVSPETNRPEVSVSQEEGEPNRASPFDAPDPDALFDLPTPAEGLDASTFERPTPEFLNDLPAAVASKPDADLPPTIELEKGEESFSSEAPTASTAFDDLPTPDIEAPSLMDDLPASFEEDAGSLETLSDLEVDAQGGEEIREEEESTEVQDAIPNLDDDLSIDLGTEGPSGSGEDPFAAAMGAEAEEISLEDEAGVPEKVSQEERSELPKEESSPAGKSRVSKIVAAVGAAAMLGVIAYGALSGDLGMPGGGEAAEQHEALDQQLAQVEAESQSKTGEKIESPDAEDVKKVDENKAGLSVDLVNTQNLAQLEAALKRSELDEETDSSQEILRWWARYRLAHWGYVREPQSKFQDFPKQLPKGHELESYGAAASVGALLVQRKLPLARRAAKKARRNYPNSAEVAWVAGLAVLPAKGPAIKNFKRALELNPQLEDAKISLGELALTQRGRNQEAGVAMLKESAAAVSLPEHRVRVAGVFWAAKRYEDMQEVLEGLDPLEVLPEVGSKIRPEFLRWSIALKMRQADVPALTSLAQKLLSLNPGSVELASRVARTRAAFVSDRDGSDAILVQAAETTKNPALLARIAYERVSLLLGDERSAEGRLSKEKQEKIESILNEAGKLPGGDAAGWVQTARAADLVARGQTKKALAMYGSAARGRPKFVAPRLAHVLLSAASAGPSLARLTQLSRSSDDPTVKYHLARLMFSRGNVAGALKLLEDILWRDPLAVDAIPLLLTWCRVNLQVGKIDLARKVAERLADAVPEDKRPLDLLIDMAIQSKQPNEISRWYQVLFRQDPDNLNHKRSLATDLMRVEEYGQARVMLDELLKEKGDLKNDPDFLYDLGRAWALKDPVKARNYLMEARHIKPSAQIYFVLGKIEESRGKMEGALEAYTEALKLDSSLVDVHLRLGRIRIQNSEAREAEKHFRFVLSRERNHREAAMLLGDSLSERDKPRDAVKFYERALGRSSDAEIMLKIARIQLQQLGQLKPAVRMLKKLINADPNLAEAYQMLGYAYKDLGKVREAKSAFETFIKVTPHPEMADEARAEIGGLGI